MTLAPKIKIDKSMFLINQFCGLFVASGVWCVIALVAGVGFVALLPLIIADGSYKEIHRNDYSHPRRQNSDLAHELAYIILGHDMNAPLKEKGERAYDRIVEKEARWLEAALLLPRKATIFMVLNEYTRPTVENKYQVSWDMFEYRAQVTAARRAANNTRKAG